MARETVYTESQNRTPDDSQAPGSNTQGPIHTLLNYVSNRLKAITGEDTWKANPLQSLKALTERKISPGPGLTGGGDLSANRTLGSKVEAFVRVDRGTGPTISPVYGTDTKITFHRESSDSANAFDLTSSTFTSPLAGVFSIYASLLVQNLSDNNTVYLEIWKNGSVNTGLTLSCTPSAGGGSLTVSGAGFVLCDAGDTLAVYARITGTGGVVTLPGSVRSVLTIGYWGAP